MADDVLEILLIEDNPGDARLIREMLRDAEALLQRIDAEESVSDGLGLSHEERLEDGLERLSEEAVDVVLLDLGLADSTGLETLATVAAATEFVPIVVLTGLRDEEVGIEAIQRGAQDYLVKDEVTSDLLVRTIHHAVERARQERARTRRLEQLEALNRLNRISQDVTHAVITTSTADDLARAVCERLVDADAYRFAWFGGIDWSSDRIVPRVAAGVEEGYLDEITITVEEGDTAQGPAGRAVRTHQVQVMQNVQTDPAFEPWRAEAAERGYKSGASIPVVYQDFLYGVVNVYAASPNAFSEPEREILSRLGDVIGHALTAIERKDALVGDTVLQLEFRHEGVAEELVALAAECEGVVEFENVVRTDDALLVYGRAGGIPREEFRDVATLTEEVDEFQFLSSEPDEYEFELLTSAIRPLADAIATQGGNIESATVADGGFQSVLEFPTGRDKRQLVELVEEHCPGAVHVAQRTVQRGGDSLSDARSVIRTHLTEKQRTALETAYYAGFFEWPRQSAGQEIADRLDITPATFTQHLRTAERKFFDRVFEDDTVDDAGTDSWSSPESGTGGR